MDLSPKAHRFQIITGISTVLLIFSVLVALPYFSNEPLNQLQTIKQKGALSVLTLNAASTYYQDANGENGFEYQLVRMFADSIGVYVKIIAVDRFSDIYPELLFETGDLAAAGLSEQDQISTHY